MTFTGVLRYEFRMQITRAILWIAMAALGALFLTLAVHPAPPERLGADIAQAGVKLNWLAPMVAGVLLADRLIRDRRLHTAELLDATGVMPAGRLWGKYLGATAAVAVPIAVIWLITVTRFAVVRDQPAAYGIGALSFLAIQVPGLLFVAGFAMVCPMVINMILFRVLFVGYWLWGNLLSPGYLPTPAGTVLTPIGDYARAGLFGGPNPFAGSGIGAPDHTGITTAALSILLLLTLPVLVVTGYSLSTRTSR
jgi:ABC-2 type transport system permease protein